MKELCTFISKEKDASGNIYLIYKCPNTACKESEGRLKVKDKTGLGNIFKHLQTCLCGGQNESAKVELEKIYKDKKSKSRNAITPWFTTSTGELAYKRGTLNFKEKELYKWIKMIVFKNWPLASVEDSDYRSFGETENSFSKKTVKDVIIVMARLVVEKISVEMKTATRGAIIHDGWSKFGRHYVCLFATYIGPGREVVQVLLRCAPMNEVDDSIDDNVSGKTWADIYQGEEASSFTAKVR